MYFEGLDLPRLLVLVAGFSLYFIPSVIAVMRDHHRRLMIGLLNLLLGWTLIGWLIAFFWATTKVQVGDEEEEAEQEYVVDGSAQVSSATGRKYSQAS